MREHVTVPLTLPNYIAGPDEQEKPGVPFTVDARMLSVKAESGVSDKDRAEVQSNAQS